MLVMLVMLLLLLMCTMHRREDTLADALMEKVLLKKVLLLPIG